MNRVLKTCLFALGLMSIVLLAIPALVTSHMTKGPVVFGRVYTAEEFGLTSNRLSLSTSDGLNIVAYEVQTQNPKAIVIFLSGIHNPSVTAFFGHSKMLEQHGYASMLVEMRAHAPSDGRKIALGYREHMDVAAAVEYIQSEQRYHGVPIVVYGVSMGGATAINAAARIPEIAAVISVSAYSSWEDAFCDNIVGVGAPRLYATVQKPFVQAYIAIAYGLDSLVDSPKNNISKLGQRPALIIHSTDDSQVRFGSFERLVANAPEHVETWVKQGDYHFILAAETFLHPDQDDEYHARITEFLEMHFGGFGN